jgi:hypothetical protein
MPMTPPPDPILGRFRAVLAETYGDRLERPILFGSRARGDARCAEAPDIPNRPHSGSRATDRGLRRLSARRPSYPARPSEAHRLPR